MSPKYLKGKIYETEDFLGGDNKWENDGDLRKPLISTVTINSETYSVVSAIDIKPDCGRESVLTRGLQVPSRTRCVTSGFKYPSILQSAGISSNEWRAFTSEVKSYASLSTTQWVTVVGSGIGTGVISGAFIGWLAIIPAGFIVQKMRKHREHRNIILADQNGGLSECVNRWNEYCFNARGLAVRVDVPGNAKDMEDMDVSSTKLFKYQHKSGFGFTRFGSTGGKEVRYQMKEGHARTKAAYKGRIVITPLNKDSSPTQQPSRLRTGTTHGLDGARHDDLDDAITEVESDQATLFEPLLPERKSYPKSKTFQL